MGDEDGDCDSDGVGGAGCTGCAACTTRGTAVVFKCDSRAAIVAGGSGGRISLTCETGGVMGEGAA